MMQMPCNQPELMLEMPLLELEPWQVGGGWISSLGPV